MARPVAPSSGALPAACLARDPACASAALGALAGLLWVAAHALLCRARCSRRGWQEPSVPCIIYSFVGSMCNTIGAVLANQLALQVLTGAYMAAVDMVHFLLTLFPVCASEPDQPGSRKRRRKQVRGSFYALALPLCMGPGWYVLATASSSPEEFHGTQRRPLGTALQENTELLGFALGLLATFVAFTARIPLLSRVCRGRLSPATQLWASISSALASVLYAAAIVAPDQQPAYVMRALPWLLLSLGSAALDLTIACLSCMMKSQLSQQLGLVAEATETLDMRALLAQAVEEEEWEGSEEEKAPDWLPLNMFPAARCPPVGAAVGRGLALTLQQVQQAGCGATRLPGDGQTGAAESDPPDPPDYPAAQIPQAKLSSSSANTSSASSELEWDFADMNLPWTRNGTDVPHSQPSRHSLLNAGCVLDAKPADIAATLRETV